MSATDAADKSVGLIDERQVRDPQQEAATLSGRPVA
jgi:hypothetical protein